MEDDPLTDAFDIYIENVRDKGEKTKNYIAEYHDMQLVEYEKI